MSHTSQVRECQRTLAEGDVADALRIIQSAITVAAIPSLVSHAARDMALAKLREQASSHPGYSEILQAIIQHVERHQ